eukprot:Clim_evm20s109 gene=Clim_evmTU20s109
MSALTSWFRKAAQLGPRETLRQIIYRDALRVPGVDYKLIGTDQWGNKYYENPNESIGKSRYVDYKQIGNVIDCDASQVPAEWHRWLHYMTDDPPTAVPPPRPQWVNKFRENLSGTPEEYVPWSTATPKVQAWDPSNPKKGQEVKPDPPYDC